MKTSKWKRRSASDIIAFAKAEPIRREEAGLPHLMPDEEPTIASRVEPPIRAKSKRNRIKERRAKRNVRRFYVITADGKMRARDTGVHGPKASW